MLGDALPHAAGLPQPHSPGAATPSSLGPDLGKQSVLIKKVLHQGGGRRKPISCSSPATTVCSGALLAPPPHPGLAGPDTGVNGLETIWGLEGADVSCPKQEAFRFRPQTSRRPRHPIAPAVPAANATGMAMGPERAAPPMHPPVPHNQRHHQAGLETCICSGKKNGREFRGVWAVPGTGLRTLSRSLPVAAQCPHGRVLTPAAPEPAAHRYGSGSARRRDGDRAAAARGRGLPPHAARLLTGPVPRSPAAL